jgi:very-short-patch-repair endonuclease
MDFLLLLPGYRRIVLEVDGQQHYSTETGTPSPAVYSTTTHGDRDLRLSGYEVYRFSSYELTGQRAPATVKEFFDRLLARRANPH